MTKRDIKRFEATLHDDRERTMRTLSRLNEAIRQLDAAVPDEGTGADEEEGAVATMEREMESVEAAGQIALLEHIDDALATIYADPRHYGRCERCGESIPTPRLRVLPWTRRCRVHALPNER